MDPPPRSTSQEFFDSAVSSLASVSLLCIMYTLLYFMCLMKKLVTAEIKWLWPGINSVTVQNGLEIRSILKYMCHEVCRLMCCPCAEDSQQWF